MFGFIYLSLKGISHIGYGIKSLIHDSHAKIDERTNTYMGYDGQLHDADTNKKVYWEVDKNGDEVLKDSPTHVVRNLSGEKRLAQSDYLRKNTDARALDTMKMRSFQYRNEKGRDVPARATIYKDLYSGSEYATRKIDVHFKEMNEEVEFYVEISNPYKLVCISDRQKESEKLKKKYNQYNWCDNEDEKEFIKYYNDLPIDFIKGRSPLIFFST